MATPQAHSAAGSALGYQYQSDYALYALVKDGGPGRSISLELHDDVAWDESGTPVEKLQVKHTIKGVGGLTDTSDSIWRTLKVWMDDGDPGDPDGAKLFLVSSGVAVPGTAAHALRESSRKPEDAVGLLTTAANVSSKTPNTATARKEFLALSVPARSAFVGRIRVLDSQPTILDLDAELRRELWKHLPDEPTKQDEFMDQLWGWWRQRAVDMLAYRFVPDRALNRQLSSSELKHQLLRLTIAFSEEGLPEFEDLHVDPGAQVLNGLENEPFVRQLELVGLKLHTGVVRRAIVDYYRAFASEVRWVDQDFLRSDEVGRYERRLCEAWDVAFGLMCAQLGDAASDEQQRTAGLALLTDILSRTPLRIRSKVDQDFYYRGKHHMLAQPQSTDSTEPAIGWHPEFRERLNELLAPKASA